MDSQGREPRLGERERKRELEREGQLQGEE
jgi:hypothetical protein